MALVNDAVEERSYIGGGYSPHPRSLAAERNSSPRKECHRDRTARRTSGSVNLARNYFGIGTKG